MTNRGVCGKLHPLKTKQNKPTVPQRKKNKINKIKKIHQNDHDVVYEWVTNDEFSRGNLFWSPHLPQNIPRNAPDDK